VAGFGLIALVVLAPFLIGFVLVLLLPLLLLGLLVWGTTRLFASA